tara:strand:+ start:640 stop:936 length:297 start_codon:yes stop_codon:yes gene_type:complete
MSKTDELDDFNMDNGSLQNYIERLDKENQDRAKLLLNVELIDYITNNPSHYYDIAKMANNRHILEKEWTMVERILLDLKEVSKGQKARLDKYNICNIL